MKYILTFLFITKICFAQIDSVNIQEPPFNDPSGIGYAHIQEVPSEFEVLDASSCLCGGEELTYDIYWLVFDWDAEPFVIEGGGGQLIYNQKWVNNVPCGYGFFKSFLEKT